MPLLKCTKCPKELPLDSDYQRCPACNEPLEVYYESMPRIGWDSFPWEKPALLRYAKVLPIQTYRDSLSLGEGATPLIPAERLGSD